MSRPIDPLDFGGDRGTPEQRREGLVDSLSDAIFRVSLLPKESPYLEMLATLRRQKHLAECETTVSRDGRAIVETVPVEREGCECTARKALEVFGAGAVADSIDSGDYSIMRERIADWFGVSDFRAARAALSAPCPCPCPCEELRDRWECFHCGFKTSDPAEAAAHFGERDDAEEFTPTCTWWAKLSADERAQEFQDLRQELNSEREESGRLNITNEGLEHRLTEFENVIDARFKGARSINDIFHLYDTMEGLKLVAEAEVESVERAVGFRGNPGELADVVAAILAKRDQLRAERDAAVMKVSELSREIGRIEGGAMKIDRAEAIQKMEIAIADAIERAVRETAESCAELAR